MGFPLEQCYWVVPGRLLAGPYPGHRHEDARRRLRRLLDEEIDLFVDLTEEGESPLVAPYAASLVQEGAARGRTVEHRRMPIADMGVPTMARMREILDLLDDMLAAGRTVYVHCLGGIGRTGTVVGCYLVRHGIDGHAALDRLAELLAMAGRDVRSPETEEQHDFVRAWAEHER
jgi:hypothetical protein